MAHTLQARKRVRQNNARNALNRTQRSAARTAVKNTEKAIAANNTEVAQGSMPLMMKKLHQLVSKGLMKKNTAARKISRMSKRLSASAAK